MTKLNPSNDSDDRDERIVALERALVAAHARADAAENVASALREAYANLVQVVERLGTEMGNKK